MMIVPKSVTGVLLSLAVSATITPALTDATDYFFEPVNVEVRNAPGSEIAVRLIHRPSGRPVAGAVIFRTKLDMSSANMSSMAAKVVAVSSSEPGIYKFRADFTMAGSWALELAAQVPGENESVEDRVIFRAND